MKLANISLSRVSVSVWLFVVIMSYAPVFAHLFIPWFDYSQYYFTVHFLDSTALTYFKGLAAQGGIVGFAGQVLVLATFALQGIMILLEGVFTGLHPVWVMFGLNQPLASDTSITLADLLSGFLYMFYAWTLYQAYQRGLET